MMREEYKVPSIRSENLDIGVYGSYNGMTPMAKVSLVFEPCLQ